MTKIRSMPHFKLEDKLMNIPEEPKKKETNLLWNINSNNILSPVNWLDVFRKNKDTRKLFEEHISLSKKENSSADHIIFISDSEMLRKNFVNAIAESFNDQSHIKLVNSNSVNTSIELASVLTVLEPGDIVVYEITSKLNEDVVDLLLEHVLHDFQISINIDGAGKNVIIDLPRFTLLLLAQSLDSVPAKLESAMEYVIDFHISREDYDDLKIRELSYSYKVTITSETISLIRAYDSSNKYRSFKTLFRFISDYLLLHPELKQPLDYSSLSEIISEIETSA